MLCDSLCSGESKVLQKINIKNFSCVHQQALSVYNYKTIQEGKLAKNIFTDITSEARKNCWDSTADESKSVSNHIKNMLAKHYHYKPTRMAQLRFCLEWQCKFVEYFPNHTSQIIA